MYGRFAPVESYDATTYGLLDGTVIVPAVANAVPLVPVITPMHATATTLTATSIFEPNNRCFILNKPSLFPAWNLSSHSRTTGA
jgi:hypothetical protein